MAHFAQINENNVVQQVLVIEQEEINSYRWGDPATWIQTSYNTHGGVYYTPNTNDPAPDQSKAFRKNYAGIGFSWDGIGFFLPQPYPSWIKDSFTYQWNAPVPYPIDGRLYRWDEETVSWFLLDIQLYPSWIKDSFTYQWNAPVPCPADSKPYCWDEDTLSWIEFIPPTE